MKMSHLRLFTITCFILSVNIAVDAKPKVILLLIDGLRYDRFDAKMPTLESLDQKGVRAEWMDGVFVTFSSPSMYSIATGLYPESHGVVSNIYYDVTTKERTDSYSETLNVTEWFDTGVEPIWVTAKLNGMSVGNIMYPGGMKPVKGIVPDKIIPSDPWWWATFTMEERVDTAITWLKDDDFDLVMIYFDNPDTVLHVLGTTSAVVNTVLRSVDDNVDYLFSEIDANGLSDTVNVIIVSDHGHKNAEKNSTIRLLDFIEEDDLEWDIFTDPTFQLLPKDGKIEKVMTALENAHPNLHVYRKEDFPERFHYAKNDRIMPILGFMDPGWNLIKDVRVELPERNDSRPILEEVFSSEDVVKLLEDIDDRTFISTHGYDNKDMSMKSSFYAKGPFFKQGYVAPPLESVDIYEMMCEILQLEPVPNNGSRLRWADMVANDVSESTTPVGTTSGAISSTFSTSFAIISCTLYLLFK